MRALTKNNPNRLQIVAGVIIYAAAIVTANGITSFAMEVKQSSDFLWKYEMDVLPSTENLDDAGGADFTLSGAGTANLGILTMPVDCYLEAPSTGLWQNQISFSQGWTIEARIKVIEQTQGDWVWQVFAGAPGGSSTATLSVAAGGQGWLSGSSLGENDNTDDFHVFRIVQPASTGSFTVWRDEVLLGSGISPSYTLGNSLWFGDGGSDFSGTTQVDYFRITPGAFSPVGYVEPQPDFAIKKSADFSVKYEMDAAPPVTELTVNGSTATTFDGAAKYSSHNNDAWLESPTGGMWQGNYNNSDGYTIEMRLKVDSGEQTIGWGLFASTGDTAATSYLTIGSEGQGWGGVNLNLGQNDNSDSFHVFRLVKGLGADGFYVWRDGELIARDLGTGYSTNNDTLWFGDGSGDFGGNVELDYIRFESGAYAPSYIMGDADCNDVVDEADAARLAANWLTASGATWGMGDFNDDGRVDDIDATILATNWGAGASSSSVPEPCSGTLVLTCGIGLLALLRRKK